MIQVILIFYLTFIESNTAESFPKFTYDYLIMHYGLKTIALKNLGALNHVLQLLFINFIGSQKFS